VTCALNNLLRAPISFIQLDEDRINKMLSVFKSDRNFDFTTSSIAKYGKVPLFERKMGKDVKLAAELRFKDVSVMFGQYDTDVIMEYTMMLDVRKHEKDAESVFYDELRMVTTG
jgi:hypothetical protein